MVQGSRMARDEVVEEVIVAPIELLPHITIECAPTPREPKHE